MNTVTVIKETNYFHPDMHLHTQGYDQDAIMTDFINELKEIGVVANAIKELCSDGKEYITHISYTGDIDTVTKVCAEHDIIELENAGVAQG